MPILLLLWMSALPAPAAPQVVGGRWDSILGLEDPLRNAPGFGAAALRLGDVSGDGVDDFALATIHEAHWTGRYGTVRVYSGADGSLRYVVAGREHESGFGRAFCEMQDVSGDGRPDLVVGVPRQFGGIFRQEIGGIVILSGADGSEIRKLAGLAAYDHFGSAVAALGDVDHDGFDDFAVGAPDADTLGFQDNGSVSVHSGITGATLFLLHGGADAARLGSVVAGTGDTDGDGRGDLALGLPEADTAAGIDAGRIQFHSGAGGALLRILDGDRAGARLGSVIARLGDLDHDGRDELGLGMPEADGPAGVSAGKVFIVSPAAAAPLAILHGNQAGERFGASVAGAADLDRDGVPDFVIGAPGAPPAGRADLYSGAALRMFQDFAGLFAAEGFGTAVALVADLSGDGSLDVLTTSPGRDNGSGAATIHGVRPLIALSEQELSVTAGGTVIIALDLSQSVAGADYLILGSGRGFGATRVGNLDVPLLPDRIFDLSLAGSLPPYCVGFAGLLSSDGQAGAAIHVRPGQLPPALAGRVIRLAAIAHDGAGTGLLSSVAVELRFLP